MFKARFIGSFTLLGLLFSVPFAHAAIDFKRLFFAPDPIVIDTDKRVLAIYHGDQDFVLLQGAESGVLEMLEQGQSTLLHDQQLVLQIISDESLLFIGSDGQEYSLPIVNDKNDLNVQKQAHEHDLLSRKPASSSMSLITKDENNKQLLRNIAKLFGIPNSLVGDTLPAQARSTAGRPGWLIDKTLPMVILMGSPFEEGDIILSVDGVAVNRLAKLEKHIQNKLAANSKVFQVEFQREQRLAIMEIRL